MSLSGTSLNETAHHRSIRLPEPYDALAVARTSAAPIGDPSVLAGPGLLSRAATTPEGPGSISIRQLGTVVEAEARGPGADWLLEHSPAWVGATDDQSTAFAPTNEPLRSLHRKQPVVRIGANRCVFSTLVPIVIAQKVVGKEAGRSYRRLLHRYSEPAPGDDRLLLPMAARRILALGYEEFHPLGVERRRAETVLRLARRAAKLEALTALPPAQAQEFLLRFPGIGPWTAARLAFAALGDPDAVWTGDYHLPSLVAWNLRGQPRATDADMLELLDPYRGHRTRVLLLLSHHGSSPPRRGPRMPFRSIDRQ